MSRTTAPVWLMVALKQSGLWKEKEISHLQGVAYIHGNKRNRLSILNLISKSENQPKLSAPGVDGGDFVFYPHGAKGEKVSFKPLYNTGIFLDGTKTAHGVEPFRAQSIPISGETHSIKELRYAGNNAWNYFENDIFKSQFSENEMRMGVVWPRFSLD